MRIQDPLIVGAGPAGCAAAITLARGGQTPLLIDRNAEPGDAICGGFLSWETAKRLSTLGVDVAAIGAHPVRQLAVFAGKRTLTTALPAPSWGLSRHALDTALKAEALAAGARFETHTVIRYKTYSDRNWFGRIFDTDTGPIGASEVFLATGKHDVRPVMRIHESKNPTLGLRAVVQGSAALSALVGDRIELHLFDGGYCGIVAQEDGRVNICMAVRKRRLGEAGKNPRALFDQLGREHPELGARLAYLPADAKIDAIGSVPYGWREKYSRGSLYRLGDQAAVIPSLAGEGIDIALASGIAAAERSMNPRGRVFHYYPFQERFAWRTAIPVTVASALWHAAESPRLAAIGMPILSTFPSITRLAARLTRIS
jgi:menaquinone-9 beta-reductase